MWSDGNTTLGKATNCDSSSWLGIGTIWVVLSFVLSINIWSKVATNPAVKLVHSGTPHALVNLSECRRLRSATIRSWFSVICIINKNYTSFEGAEHLTTMVSSYKNYISLHVSLALSQTLQKISKRGFFIVIHFDIHTVHTIKIVPAVICKHSRAYIFYHTATWWAVQITAKYHRWACSLRTKADKS